MLDGAAGVDRELRFALNRKLYKELSYVERGKPMNRRLLKLKKYGHQRGLCGHCGKELPESGRNAHLDRFSAIEGYTMENTELIHSECHLLRQEAKGFS
jgi:hypothetical protein